MYQKLLCLILVIFLFSCKETNKEATPIIDQGTTIKTEFATGFEVKKYKGYKTIHLNTPWPNADKTFTYLLLEKNEEIPKNVAYDALVRVPVSKIVVTSTTHIPALEALHELDKLVGFPNTKFISSVNARKKIDNGKIKELGKNENINTEVLLNLEPDVVIGFAINGNNKTFSTIQKAGIPVLYNAAWIEPHALGRAEWIKFFGHLFNKEEQANTVFNKIVSDYKAAKSLVANATDNPTVLAGSMFKDIWNVPYGNSWVAQFITDAGGNYLWSGTKGSGSIALNIESVLEKAQQADYWISTGSTSDKKKLADRNLHYAQFKAFQTNNTFIANKKGATGGLVFYELGPNRPDLILKDLIKIFHPEVLPNHELFFYEKIK